MSYKVQFSQNTKISCLFAIWTIPITVMQRKPPCWDFRIRVWIVEFIVHNGMMKDLSVLQELPFTEQGSIIDVFTDLSVWQGIRGVIDRINANASAA